MIRGKENIPARFGFNLDFIVTPILVEVTLIVVFNYKKIRLRMKLDNVTHIKFKIYLLKERYWCAFNK